jgi:mono/diheme cytochrome c family protein
MAFPPQTHPAVEGRKIADRLGCLACHGADANGGFRNPGAPDDIPALAGGEMMMWAESEQELREWILDGHLASEERDYDRGGYTAGQNSERAIVMPAFESYLGPGELELLIEWLRTISGLQFPDDDVVARGMDLAHELGCFHCHGPMGTGGVNNPSSLKGYVPGFFGADYEELVADDAELREWIENGISDRFAKNPIARGIIARQAVKMPAYGDHMSEEQIDSLVALVGWLASSEWETIAIP